jgi:hypothetical protein
VLNSCSNATFWLSLLLLLLLLLLLIGSWPAAPAADAPKTAADSMTGQQQGGHELL